MVVSGHSDRPNTARLCIRHLSKTFSGNGSPHPVLGDFELLVECGIFVTVLGPPGCGKSTLLRIIAGLETPDPHPQGQLSLGGTEIRGPASDRGFVFQSYSSFPWLTAKENVMFGLQFTVPDLAERARIASDYLALVGLIDHADVYPRDLSGGQQQRVAIARTLATRPRLLLMDEPFAALDSLNREYQQMELLRIWRETRPTIIFVTHDISEAVFLGTTLLVLSNRPARVIEDIDIDSVLCERLASSSDSPDTGSMVRGPWLRERPEFYQIVAEMKQRLPALDRD